MRNDINDAWKEVYYQLGRNQEAPLSDDDYLRAHWITYFQYSRKRGDDYIRFLLGKFSAKNVFEKHIIELSNDLEEPLPGFEPEKDDDSVNSPSETETVQVSRLTPKEIRDYVNSLKALAEYWYYSFFSNDSSTLTEDEKVWIDKLNRVGIGYFRPLVAVALATNGSTSSPDRVKFFRANRAVHISGLLENMNRCDYLVIPSDARVLAGLKDKNVPYILCYPEVGLKDEYEKRYLQRGNTENFIDIFIGSWEGFMESLQCDTYGTHIVLSKKEYLLDVKEKIDEIILRRYPHASAKRGAKFEYRKVWC